MKALESCKEIFLDSVIQLCYDGKWINDIDRYVFLSQFLQEDRQKCEKVLGVKSFCEKSVSADVIFKTIVNETIRF